MYDLCCKQFIHKKHNLLAIADADLVNKSFKYNDTTITITREFYGDVVEKEVLLKKIKQATIINAIGRKSVSLLEKNNLVLKENIIYIEGIPHAQVVKI
ncbi:MAG: hypothetical protein DRP08_00550 [Candidatus Aenigmatarchaeota archaeon]|nr:DUF424 family protein [Candidatus Aenigmarchaeota archaeon]RLJ04902.1 MAG: hypothetical protein DRP08_00550 [Candidatus Aenigmarchaeota archaeon]